MNTILPLLLATALLATPRAARGADPNILRVHFHNDRPRSVSSSLSTYNLADMAEVEAVRAHLKANPGMAVWMEGHASSSGASWYNRRLAARRGEFLLKHLGAPAAVGTGYSAGCRYVERGVVTCGERHATEDHAASRRVDVHFVPKTGPMTCEAARGTFTCPPPTVAVSATLECHSREDCAEKCCRQPSCGEVTCPRHTRRRADGGGGACASREECLDQCCEPSTCQGLWDLPPKCGGWQMAYQHDLECGGRRDCFDKCCLPMNCERWLTERKCETFPRSTSRYAECASDTACRHQCCHPGQIIVPPEKDDDEDDEGPSVKPAPPRRDCERHIECAAPCVDVACAMHIPFTRGYAVCLDKCRGGCAGLVVNACPGDGVLKTITPKNCREICTRRSKH